MISRQAKQQKETWNIERQYKVEEAVLQKEKRQADKSLVELDDKLTTTKKDFELMKTERSYDISAAVHDAKRKERARYTSFVQATKEKGHKLKSEFKSVSMVSINFMYIVIKQLVLYN